MNTIIETISLNYKCLKPHLSKGQKIAAFFDFDGTILKGDCTEGLIEKDSVQYVGLAEMAIKEGYSSHYSDYSVYFDDYQHNMKKYGHQYTYCLVPKIFSGADVRAIKKHAHQHITAVICRYYFSAIIAMFKTLKAMDVEIFVVSASADFFVKEAAKSLGIPENHITGIQTKISNGIVTDEIIPPINYASGKIEQIEQLIQQFNVIPIAGFGNSYATDGAFLKWLTHYPLPAGKTISVMINGGPKPEGQKNSFTTIDLCDIVGDRTIEPLHRC